MLFYIILFSLLFIILGSFIALKFTKFKKSEKFTKVTNLILKIAVVIYCVLVFISIFLPDSFVLCLSSDELGNGKDQAFAILRWFNMVNFVVLPIAVFYKNRTIRNIALSFGVIVSLVAIFYYPQFLECFTSSAGRGLNSISTLPESIKNFLINADFRSIVFLITCLLQLLIPLILAINEKHIFNFKNKKEYINYFLVLPFVILSCIPIYVPQYLFGYSNIIFSAFSTPHILWIVGLFVVTTALYFIFKKQDKSIKMVVLFVLALSLFMQYNEMFGAISINLKRLPLQLCNIGAYLILLSLICQSKRLFNFTIIINVVGVLFALAMPDLDDKGLFNLYNMHFILEHSNVLIVPVLALCFQIFPRLDRFALRDCLIGFTIYFIFVLILGTIFNSIALTTGNGFYEANYLFMFDKAEAVGMLPFLSTLFDTTIKIGSLTFYPLIQGVVYAVFILVCLNLYMAIRLIYIIKDKIFLNSKSLA